MVAADHAPYVVSLLTMLSVQPRPTHPFVTNTMVELARKNGMQSSGVEWSGVEWSGVEWSGVEWSGVAKIV